MMLPAVSFNLDSVNISSVVSNSLLNLTSLTHLDLSWCGLLGKFPDGIFHLPHLNYLSIWDNSAVTGYFPEFINSSSPLQYLDLSYTNFSGKLFHSIGNFKPLKTLVASGCNFYGSNPTSLGNLTEMTSLTHLDLSYGLRGKFPDGIFQLPHLNELIIHDNPALTGYFPEFINSSSPLQYLDLSATNFSGELPDSIGNLKSLKTFIYFYELDLRKNNFSGTIPDTFAKENYFETINLDSNGFEGPIPKSLQNCKMLQVLDLGHNKFSDKFPFWLGNLTSLQILILRSNKFYGPIPNSKFKFPFPNLRVMDLSNNYFTGPLPRKYFKNLNAMMNVNEASFKMHYLGMFGSPTTAYYYNDCLTIVIKGSIIEMVKVLTIFTAIDLSKNNFEGEIPQIIGKQNSIRGLNLSHNSLTGHIPASLANLTMLEWLDLSSNKLTGEIPQQLRNLKSLEVLNLSRNQLIGPIPQGNQFDTFSNDSYIDNLALCGPPLLNACNPRTPQPPTLMFQQEDNTSSGFNWEVILRFIWSDYWRQSVQIINEKNLI
ncbi:hypothetical protein ACSBR2_025098 [Camellia fascicularis]